jgi:hypothetical protein
MESQDEQLNDNPVDVVENQEADEEVKSSL